MHIPTVAVLGDDEVDDVRADDYDPALVARILALGSARALPKAFSQMLHAGLNVFPHSVWVSSGIEP